MKYVYAENHIPAPSAKRGDYANQKKRFVDHPGGMVGRREALHWVYGALHCLPDSLHLL